jgi:ABC-2 type transport system ATP-binding protein
MNELIINQVKKNFKNKNVLAGVSLKASAGNVIVILGGIGSGKTTLLSILAGILLPDAGSFRWNDRDLFAETKLRNEIIGYIPQGTPLMEELTARDNLLLWYEKKNA